MEALALLLTEERLLVRRLVVTLVELQRRLRAGDHQVLRWASDEVDRATTAVRELEFERAVLVSWLGMSRGLVDPSLSELIADAPEAWRSRLELLQGELRSAATEIAHLGESLGAAGRSELPSLSDFLV